jgi:hypothetical protein
MKLLPALLCLPLVIALSSPANAAKKKEHHAAPAAASEPSANDPSANDGDAEPRAVSVDHAVPTSTQSAKSPALDFDFFGGPAGGKGEDGAGATAAGEEGELAAKSRTRRWMLKTHQTLGILTWASLVATVTIGQLNYNELYGGGGSNKWQNWHRGLVISTSALFAATGTFALLAPTPYKKPLHFDTGLVHRIAVIGATLGMVTEGVLGWITTHQGDAGNPHNLRTMAQVHQIVGYTTLGFLTVAGAVWIF